MNKAVPYLLLAAVAFGLFADLLFLSGDRIASARFGDINHYYYASRAFSSAQMKAGDFPLWNPLLFSGTPHLPNIQTALLYPPNIVYLVLPLPKAFNFDMALHVFLFGAFTCAWALSRRLSGTAAFTAGVLAMFSGAFMAHILAGHVPMVASFAWTPLVLLALDKTIARRSFSWAVVGAFAVDMMILAGSPHAVFMTFAAAAPYAILKIRSWALSPRAVACLAVFVALPILLSAIQLWPTLAFIQRCIPHGDGSFGYATTHSFPPENFLMFILPNFWGNSITIPYGSRWFAWEVFAFIGVGGLFLILMSFFTVSIRRTFPLYAVAVILFVIALGRYTPIYTFLYEWVPGFGNMRAPARYLVVASPVLAILAAEGFQSLAYKPRRLHFIIPLAAAGLLLGAALYVNATSVNAGPDSPAARFARYICMEAKPSRAWLRIAPVNLRNELLRSGAVLALMALLIGVFGKRTFFLYVLAALCAVEMVFFAYPMRAKFDPRQTQPPDLPASLAKAQNTRVLDSPNELNRIFYAGGLDLWGSDPLISLDYASFIKEVAGIKAPIHKAGVPGFWNGARLSPALRTLRLAYVIDDTRSLVQLPWVPLPQFFLAGDCAIANSPEDVLNALRDPNFDPLFEVTLQSPPSPAPESAAQTGTVKVLHQTSDQFILEVDTPAPAILVNTDAYSPGWTVKPLQPSSQDTYELMPADGVIRGIPLAAGRHKILLEYVPPLFRAGMVVSAATTILVAVAALIKLKVSREPAQPTAAG